MPIGHLSLELLGSLASASATHEELGSVAAHLALCASCRDLIGSLPPEMSSSLRQRLVNFDPSKRFSVLDYRSVIKRVAERCGEDEKRVDRDRDGARALLLELERVSPERRRLLVANVKRFQSFALAELLLETSRSSWTNHPVAAEQSAVLACDIAESLTAEGYEELLLNDLRAEAWSFVANSCRIRGRLAEAEKAFGMAESYLLCGTGETIDRVQLLDLRVSFWRDSGEIDKALGGLEQVIAARRTLGDRHLVGRSMISKALLLEDQGRSQEAIDLLYRAESFVDVSREPLLELNRLVNLIANLAETERFTEALTLLPAMKQRSQQVGARVDRLRARRVEAKVLYGVGQRVLGEELLRSVHESFLKAGMAPEAADVALQLAEIYLREGRLLEVRKLSEQVRNYASLATTDAEKEAFAALVGLAQPVEDQVLARAVIQRLAQRLRSMPANALQKDSYV